MLLDTHAHLQFNAYKDDGDEVVARSLEHRIALVMPSSQIDTSKRAIEYAERWDNNFVWAAVGLHPIHTEDIEVDGDEVGELSTFRTRAEEFDVSAYEPLLSSKKVVAIGEIGLDYWRKPKGKAKREAYIQRQQTAFIQQLDLALKYKLPVILHCRVAFDDLIDIVQNHPYLESVGGASMVSHSFTGDAHHLQQILDAGMYIGVNGLVFKLGMVREAVKNAPLERIVLETDAPYLAPPNTAKRNEPMYMKKTAQEVADINGISLQEVEEQTTQNAINLFRLPISHTDNPAEYKK